MIRGGQWWEIYDTKKRRDNPWSGVVTPLPQQLLDTGVTPCNQDLPVFSVLE